LKFDFDGCFLQQLKIQNKTTIIIILCVDRPNAAVQNRIVEQIIGDGSEPAKQKKPKSTPKKRKSTTRAPSSSNKPKQRRTASPKQAVGVSVAAAVRVASALPDHEEANTGGFARPTAISSRAPSSSSAPPRAKRVSFIVDVLISFFFFFLSRCLIIHISTKSFLFTFIESFQQTNCADALRFSSRYTRSDKQNDNSRC
jgi:hypothetical protein